MDAVQVVHRGRYRIQDPYKAHHALWPDEPYGTYYGGYRLVCGWCGEVFTSPVKADFCGRSCRMKNYNEKRKA